MQCSHRLTKNANMHTITFSQATYTVGRLFCLKILVTGKNGQLGYDVLKVLAAKSITAQGTDIEEFDITDSAATQGYIAAYAPDAVIHCAAYTAVDKAEDNPELCRRINVDGTANIATACKQLGAKLMYISTDYVYPGEGDKPYEVGDATGPKSVYGQTKLDGELAARAVDELFIVRISWVFGKNGHNFVRTMLKLGAERPEINVVDDQIGSPTYTADLAPLLCDMIAGEKYGTYQATNEGYCSWADFTEEIFRQAGLGCAVKRIPTSEYKTAAARPLNSRLSKATLDAAGFVRLPSWQDALARYLHEIEVI